MTKLFTAILLISASTSLAHGAETKIKMAVTRGQTQVNASQLPLVCITFTLDHAALPLTEVNLTNAETHEKIFADVGSLDPTHPHVFTAMEGQHRIITMVILHLAPGRYVVESLEFEGKKRSYFTMTLRGAAILRLVVKPRNRAMRQRCLTSA